jgi:hypothetical protein
LSSRSVALVFSPKLSNSFAASIIAVSEVMPSETRLSVTQSVSSPVIPLTIPHSFFSSELSCLACCFSSALRLGCGSFLLSTLPFGVIGMMSICIVTDGTIYGGSSSAINPFSDGTSTLLSDTT